MKKLSILFVLSFGVVLMTSGKNPKMQSKEKPKSALIGTTWRLAHDLVDDEDNIPNRFLEFRKDMTFESRRGNGAPYNSGIYSLFNDSSFVTIHSGASTANYYHFSIQNDTLRFNGNYLDPVFSSLDQKYYYRLEPVNEVWVKVTDNKLDSSQNNKAQNSSCSDQNMLSNVALNDKDANVRKVAVQKLTDQNTLSLVALNDKDVDVRKLAVEKLTDQNTLSLVALNDENSEIRKMALKRLK